MNTSERRTGRKHHTPRRNHPLLSWYALFFLLCLLFLPMPAHAQEPGPTTWEWRTFTKSNSPLLPGPVTQLLEDSQSRIWIGTWSGINLYQDGAWQTFIAGSPLALGSVSVLLEDSQGRIWAGTRGGVSLYQGGIWQTFTEENSFLAPGGVNVLVEDSQGRIWVGTTYYDNETRTSKGSVSFYKDGIWQTFTEENSVLAPGGVDVLLEGSQGRIWVGTSYYDNETGIRRGGISFYKDGAWQTFTEENSFLAPGGVNVLLEDSLGCMWAGTSRGVSFYQDGNWRTFTPEDSPLPSHEVTVLLEDSRDRIWIGTWDGASLYQDGTWQTFTEEDSSQLLYEVTVLLEDSQGRIWIGTRDGVSLYQDDTWQTSIAEDSPLARGGVNVLSEDSQGRIWIGTSSGISFYQDGVWDAFTSENSPLIWGMVELLLEDSQGRIWVGTDEGISLYHKGAWQTFTEEDSYPLSYGVTVLLEDSLGRIWVGTWRGISFYQDGDWQTFTPEDSPLPSYGVTILLEDSQGRIWAGTRGGVSLYQGGIWQTFTEENSFLAPGGVNALVEDSQSRIWVGTTYYDNETRTSKGGVSLYQDGIWQAFTEENSFLAPGEVNVLLEDSQGHIWVGTNEGISLYQYGTWQTFTKEESPLLPYGVTVLLEDSRDCIWVGTHYYDDEKGTNRGGISLYRDGTWQIFSEEDSLLPSYGVTALLEDSQGRIWIGTSRGVSLYQDGIWRTFIEGSPLTSGSANVLLEDSQGRIWAGTLGGVSLYQDGAWQTFTAENSSLAPGALHVLLEGSPGRIWAGTWGGINLYQDDAWQTFTAEDSPLTPAGFNVLLEDSQGCIWTGTSRGVSARCPSGDRPCAFVRYAGFALGQTTSLRYTSAVTLTSSRLFPPLMVGFSGIDAESDLDRLLFRCQLIGYDDEETLCASPVRYAALFPGTYTFRVRALDEDLMPSEPATATITLISTAPPSITIPGLGILSLANLAAILGGSGILAGGIYVLTRRLYRACRLAAWRKGADPYVVGAVIAEPEQFYGREEALTELLRALEAGNHIALYGERRIGKTSLLYQLAHHLRDLSHPNLYLLPVFVNLQMVPEPRFFSALAGAIAKAARRELEQPGQDLPSLQIDSRSTGYDSLDLADDLEAIVEALQEVTEREPCIALLLDEADKMNGYNPSTQEALRGLLMTPVGGHVRLVWSGQTMNREWHLESSPWYNLFKQEIHLGGLKKEPAVRLIQEPVKGVFTYDDGAVQRILQLTGSKPYPIQRLSSFCIRRLLGENRFQITTDDVEAAWQELQAEDARRAAEGATDLTYEPPRPAWTVAEEGTEYHADKEKEP